MFQQLEVDAAMWLEEPATHWSEIPSYVRFERLVKGMTLVSCASFKNLTRTQLNNLDYYSFIIPTNAILIKCYI